MHATSSARDEPGGGTRPGVTWEPFGIPPETWEDAPEHGGVKWLHLSPRRLRAAGDRSATWLRAAMTSLGLLAAAAAAVSFQAQYKMVLTAKGIRWAAALEAGIPDAAALVFASLGIALALYGKRAIRARVLNVASVATSVSMNLLAAAPGWRNLAIWVMPPIAYALASDTAIGVIRAWTLARKRELGEALADEETTPLAALTGVLLWTLRLAVSPKSTLNGFKDWVLDECPVAPGRRAGIAAIPPVTEEIFPCPDCCSVVALPDGSCASCGWPHDQEDDEEPPVCPACLCIEHGPDSQCPNAPAREQRQHRDGSKTSRFLALVEEQHGPLSAIDPSKVSRISSELAPLVDLHTGSARSVLGKRVRATQNGHSGGQS